MSGWIKEEWEKHKSKNVKESNKSDEELEDVTDEIIEQTSHKDLVSQVERIEKLNKEYAGEDESELSEEEEKEEFERLTSTTMIETFFKATYNHENSSDIKKYFTKICKDWGKEKEVIAALDNTNTHFKLKLNFEKLFNKSNKEKKKWIEQKDSTKKLLQSEGNSITLVQLPQSEHSFKNFVNGIVNGIKERIENNNINLFYRPRLHILVEYSSWDDKVLDQKVSGLREIKSTRLVNLLGELNFVFYRIHKSKYGEYQMIKEITKNQCELLMENKSFLNALPKIDRYFTCPIPYKIKGKLELPKKGWDEKFDSFLVEDSPDLEELGVEESKKIILKLYDEFCLEKEVDKTKAIAHLLTPACRGLYSNSTARTPIFFYMANRERAGKDYCAGIVSIVYEGYAHDNPPIATDERNSGGGSEELRKKLTSAMKRGIRLFHSANNRGKINNAVLEQVLTSEHWTDRLLGKNTEIMLNNEVDFSLSANVGISCTSDLDKRSSKINLFYGPENINKRIFKTPDLHGFIKKNRGEILSAIYTLIKTWVKAGEPSDCIHTSFHEWARVVGGIMTYHKLGDPTVENEDSAVGGDTETQEMKEFFNYMVDLNSEGQTDLNKTIKENAYTMSELMDHIRNGQDKGETFFSDFDLEKHGPKISLSNKLRKYLNRELSNIKFVVHSKNEVKRRETYKFIKKCQSSQSLQSLPLHQTKTKVSIRGICDHTDKTYKTDNIKGKTILKSDKFINSTRNKTESETISEPIHQKIKQYDWLDLWFDKNDSESEVDVLEMISKDVKQAKIDEEKKSGRLYESRPGFLRRL